MRAEGGAGFKGGARKGSMAAEVFESIEKIKENFDGASFLETNGRRKKALEHYFSRHGIVQLGVDARKGGWPVLIYPTPEKLSMQIDSLTQKRRVHAEKKRSWQLTHLKASSKDVVAHAKKIVDPLYWQHVAKTFTDGEYRDSAKAIDLHASLVSDSKYRPMIDAFVHNPEYRKQLTETVKISPVYQHHKGLAKHAEDRKKLQMDVSKSMVKRSHEKMEESGEQLETFKELLKWSKENGFS
jgi:hypothetical protein